MKKVARWPGTIRSQEELDSALEDGEKSGRSPYTIRQIVERTISRLKHG